MGASPSSQSKGATPVKTTKPPQSPSESKIVDTLSIQIPCTPVSERSGSIRSEQLMKLIGECTLLPSVLTPIITSYATLLSIIVIGGHGYTEKMSKSSVRTNCVDTILQWSTFDNHGHKSSSGGDGHGNGRWTLLGRLPMTRVYSQAAIINDNLYIAGGCHDVNNESPLPYIHRMNLITGQWAGHEPLKARDSPVIAYPNQSRLKAISCVIDNKWYISGGYLQSAFNYPEYPLSSTECYDPLTNHWRLVPLRHAHHDNKKRPICGAAYDQRFYVFYNGGLGERYDPIKDEWEVLNTDNRIELSLPSLQHSRNEESPNIVSKGCVCISIDGIGIIVSQMNATTASMSRCSGLYIPSLDQWKLIPYHLHSSSLLPSSFGYGVIPHSSTIIATGGITADGTTMTTCVMTSVDKESLLNTSKLSLSPSSATLSASSNSINGWNTSFYSPLPLPIVGATLLVD
jgi:hypothetical protein